MMWWPKLERWQMTPAEQSALARATAAEAERDRLAAVLKEVEWAGTGVSPSRSGFVPMCPACRAMRPAPSAVTTISPHFAGCRLAAALYASPKSASGGEGKDTE